MKRRKKTNEKKSVILLLIISLVAVCSKSDKITNPTSFEEITTGTLVQKNQRFRLQTKVKRKPAVNGNTFTECNRY